MLKINNNCVCFYCKKKFHRKPSHVTKVKENFCSKKCYYQSLFKKVSKKCKRCNQIFHDIPYRIKKRKFCSHYCKDNFKLLKGPCCICKKENTKKWLNDPLKRGIVCATCYQRIKGNLGRKGKCVKCKKTKSYQFNILNGKKYCKKCYNDIYNQINPEVKLKSQRKYNLNYYEKIANDFPYKKEQLSWLDKSWSMLIKERGKKCQICNKPIKFSHHIIHKAKYPLFRFIKNNGIGLCQLCHYQAHGINLEIFPLEKNGIDILNFSKNQIPIILKI